MPKRDTELYTTPRRSPRLLRNEAPKESAESSRNSLRRVASQGRGVRKPLKDFPTKLIKCRSEKVSKKKPRKAIEVSEVRGNLSVGSRKHRVSSDGTQKPRRSPRIADLCEDVFVGERKGSIERVAKKSGNHRSSKSPRSIELIEGCQTPRRSTRVLTKLSENTLSDDRSGIVKAQNFVYVGSKAVIQKSRERMAKVSGNPRNSNSVQATPRASQMIEGFQTPRRSTRLVTQLSEKALREDRSGNVKAQNFVEQRSKSEISRNVIERSSEREDEEKKSRAVEVSRKRKQDEFEESHEAVHGWSKEQEFALQKAYLMAKPTPQFWKKVSRLVNNY